MIPPGGGSLKGTAVSYSGSLWGTRLTLALPAHSNAFGTSVALSGTGTTALVGDPTGGDGGDRRGDG